MRIVQPSRSYRSALLTFHALGSDRRVRERWVSLSESPDERVPVFHRTPNLPHQFRSFNATVLELLIAVADVRAKAVAGTITREDQRLDTQIARVEEEISPIRLPVETSAPAALIILKEARVTHAILGCMLQASGVTLSEAEQQRMIDTFAPISIQRQIELEASLRQQMWAAAGGAVVWVGEDEDGTCWAREQTPEDVQDTQRV